MNRILVTGAGAPGGPGIINCLKLNPDNYVVVCDANPEATGGKLFEPFEIIPKYNDPMFIERILEICHKYGIDSVIPLVTKELGIFASNIEIFEDKKIRVAVSALDGLDLAINKAHLLEHLSKNGIRVPEYRIITRPEQIITAFVELGYPELPVCIKPAISSGSRGFRIADVQYNRFSAFFNDKPNSVYTTPADLYDVLKDKEIPVMIAMEYLPGQEYTVDCLIQDGEIKLILPRSRRSMLNGISTSGEFINDTEIKDYCTSVLGVLRLNGPIGIQVKRNRNGEISILEINPRLQGTSVAAMGVGINLPQLAVKILKNESIEIHNEEIAWGTKFVRYFQELYYQ